MAVFKEQIFNCFYIEVVAVLKNLNLTVSTLQRCGGLERTAFNSFYFGKGVGVLKELILTVSTLQGCGSLERTDLNSFYFGKVWQS